MNPYEPPSSFEKDQTQEDEKTVVVVFGIFLGALTGTALGAIAAILLLYTLGWIF